MYMYIYIYAGAREVSGFGRSIFGVGDRPWVFGMCRLSSP